MTVAMVAVMAAAITAGEDEGVIIKGDDKIMKLSRVRIASISWVATFPVGIGHSP
jgi:hypothetical protein